MTQRILIFAGAGASTAVSREQFPTTRDFFAQLPEVIKENSIFQLVIRFLQEGDASRIIDIEEVLWELQLLREFANSAQAGAGIVGHSLSHGTLAKIILGQGQNLGHFGTMISSTLSQCQSLIDEINATVYELYNYEPTQNELKDNWILLFNELKNSNIKSDIFTTNYDIAIETAASLNAEIDLDKLLGVKGRVSKKLNLELWSDPESDQSLLTKLHGSINWQWGANCIHVGAPVFTGNHSNHAIIYPGFKGESEASFFSPMHRYLGDRLETANAIVFIGFAFRDEYINRMLAERADPSAKIFIINPDDSIKYPIARRNLQYIHEGFDQRSVIKLIAGITALLLNFRTKKKVI